MTKLLIALTIIVVAGLVLVSKAAAAHVSIQQQIRKAFGPKHDDTALCEAAYESTGTPGHFNPTAVSPTNDHGLFQIHAGDWYHGIEGRWVGNGKWRRFFTLTELHTIQGNIRAAMILSNGGSNWRPWTGTYERGLCHNRS